MDRSWLNSVNRSGRIEPMPTLIKLRAIERELAQRDVDPRLRHLRTNGLKKDRELREACLFAYGMSCRIGQTVYVTPLEDSDFDFIGSWDVPPERHFAPTQIKEVVPHNLNKNASIQAVIDGLLEKYPNSPELTLAIHYNQNGRFDPGHLTLPRVKLAAVWVFGATKPDQSEWFLYGNILEEAGMTFFPYPE